MRRRDFTPFALLTLGTAAYGQVLVVPPANPTNKPRKVLGFSEVRTQGAHGSILTAPSQPIGPTAALSDFHFGFGNGDHKFRRLQLLVEGQMVRAALNDSNDDDPFQVYASWVNFSGGTAGVARGTGHGRDVTRLAIPAGPPRHVFALRGFEFRRNEGTDANIRHIGIRHVGGTIEVLLSDDEGMDLRGPGGAMNVLDPMHSFLHQQLRAGGRQGRPYEAIVQYVWIPEVLVASTGTITGSARGQRDAARVPQGWAAIRGFTFSFLNSDHHLLAIAAKTSGGGVGIFRDNNEDDPVRWSIDYAALRRGS